MARTADTEQICRPKPNEFYKELREEFVNAQKVMANKVREYSKEIYKLRRENNQLKRKIELLERGKNESIDRKDK